MRILTIRILSIGALLVAVFWFIDGGGYEAVITALVGLAGLFSGEFLKEGPRGEPVPASPEKDAIPEPKPFSDESIVVLPFDNLSAEPGDAYLADGVTEEITADLAGLHSLRVISRTSAMQYRGSRGNLPSIARDLSVRYVLEGSVRKAGENLRITCQLIDAENDAHLWAEKFSGTMADILDLQETVARSVAQKLSLQLDPGDEERLAERPIPDLRAYESYLRAREGLQTFSAEGLLRAQHHLTEALSITGENAVLLGQLAQVHYQLWNMGIRLDEEDLTKAREYADRALELNPKTPDHHLIRGLLEVTGGSAVKALSYFDAALVLDPEYPDALGWYPAIAGFIGLEEPARTRLERLKRIDPLNTFNSFIPIFIHIYKGRFAEALDLAERTRAARPPEMLVETGYANALAFNGRFREAAEVLRQTHRPEGGFFAREMLALACAFEGDREGALSFIDADLERWAEKDFAYATFLARVLAPIGETERAIEWLEKSVERGNINHPFLSEHDPSLAELRGHSRYDSLMERVRVQWEAYSL